MRPRLNLFVTLWLLVQAAQAGAAPDATVGSPAVSGWQVRRGSNDARAQLVRALKADPERDELAKRALQGVSGNAQEAILRQFGQDAAKNPDDFGAQLAYAQILLAARRWHEAIARFDVAVKILPSDFASRWGKAQALMGTRATRAALGELREALARARGPRNIDRAARQLIAVASSEADVTAEIDGREALLRMRPSARAAFELSTALHRAGRSREAAEQLSAYAEKVALKTQERCLWVLAEGQYRAAAGDLIGAAAVLVRARRLAPPNRRDLRRDVWFSSIEVARRLGSLASLKAELTKPVDTVEWEAVAGIADASGDLPGAQTALGEAIRGSPGRLDLRQRQIDFARRVAPKGDLIRMYQDLVAAAAVQGRENPEVVSEALSGLWQVGRAETAGSVYDKLLRGRLVPTSMLRMMAATAVRWGDERRAEKSWAVVLKRQPRDEEAVVAVGELQLQRGQRRMAMDTWRTLLRGDGSDKPEEHARVAEILAEHDFLDQALAEARLALNEGRGRAQFHRLMATILERQTRNSDAEREWEIVLRSAKGSSEISDRNEARTRLIALWTRGGRAHLEGKLGEMRESLQHDGRDKETLMFLVAVDVKLGRPDDAIALMARALSTDTEEHGARGDADSDAELMLLLVRTLRQAHRDDEAITWLERVAHRFPERARDAQLQVADIALAAHDDQRAQHFVDLATAADPDDPAVAMRAAAVQERLGHFQQAVALYRRVAGAVVLDESGRLALGSLLSRMGEVDEQRVLLRDTLIHGVDEEAIAQAGTRLMALEEASGGLAELESLLAHSADLNAASSAAAARRRTLSEMLWRLVPPIYRSQARDPAALAMLKNFSRQGLRPLLDLVSLPDAVPDLHAIEILGMLGRSEAVPGLARLLVSNATDGDDAVSPAVTRARSPLRDDLASATVVALGRLGGEEARLALESFEPHAGVASRLLLLWALGRTGGVRAIQLAKQEVNRKGTDGAVLGCLTLGRAGDQEAVPILLSVAEDPANPAMVRMAAMLGLGLGGHIGARSSLARFVETDDRMLASAARAALEWLGQGETQTGLLRPRVGAGGVVDDGVAIVGSRVDVETLLQILRPPFWSPGSSGYSGSAGEVGPVSRVSWRASSIDGASSFDVP